MRVYLCYGLLFGEWVLEKIVSDLEQARYWVSKNPEYLKYEEHYVE